jgi:hypothetical protein
LDQVKKTEEGNLYWTDFLGNYGGVERNEDAIFSSFVTLNALLDIWTLPEK